MKTIHKIQLPLHMGQHVKYTLPFNSKILSCNFQGTDLMVWYLVDTTVEGKEQRNFYIYEAGKQVPAGIERLNFIGTAVHSAVTYSGDDQYYVVHLFEGQLVN